jgi:hypothetical protein
MILECAGRAKRDGALDNEPSLAIQSGVALRLPPHSKSLGLHSRISFHDNLRRVVLSVH